MSKQGRGGQGGRAGGWRGEGEVVVRPTNQRRYQIEEGVFDSTPSHSPRFERCTELRDTGKQREQFLLKRVPRNTEEEIQASDQDLVTMAQVRVCLHILTFKDAWVKRGSPEVLHVLCGDARMFLSVCLQGMASEAGPDPPSPFSPELVFPRWLYQLASALQYLHESNPEQPVLHRDLQPDNIMVTDNCNLKVCAFGTSKRLDKGHRSTGTVMGTDLFKSPEICEGKRYDQSADIWSFGVTAVNIASYTRAKKAGSAQQLLAILEKSGQEEPTQRVVKGALQTDPARRPKASDIVHILDHHYTDSVLKKDVPPELYPSPLVTTRDRPTTSKHNNKNVNDTKNKNPQLPPHQSDISSNSNSTGDPQAPQSRERPKEAPPTREKPETPVPRAPQDTARKREGKKHPVSTAETTTQTSFVSERSNPQQKSTSTQTSQSGSVRSVERHEQPHRHQFPPDVVVVVTTRRQQRNKKNNVNIKNNDDDGNRKSIIPDDCSNPQGRQSPSRPVLNPDEDHRPGHLHRHREIDRRQEVKILGRLTPSLSSSIPWENTVSSSLVDTTLTATSTVMTSSTTTSSGTLTSGSGSIGASSADNREMPRQKSRSTKHRVKGPPDQHPTHPSSLRDDGGDDVDDCEDLPADSQNAMSEEALREIRDALNRTPHPRQQQQEQDHHQQRRRMRSQRAQLSERASEEDSSGTSDRQTPLPQDRGSKAGRQRRAKGHSRGYHGDTDNTSGLGDSLK